MAVFRGRELSEMIDAKQPRTAGRQTFKTFGLALVTCLALNGVLAALPDDPFQRWQLTDAKWYRQLFWAYNRIHFDERPIDIAIMGSSKTLLGLNAEHLERKIAEAGVPLKVANLSILGAGRNVQWSIAEELLQKRAPKLIILGVEDTTYPWGHPGFKYVGSPSEILFPPEPLLKDYFKDLAYLPWRQATLLAARVAPQLVGLKPKFDPGAYTLKQPAETVTKWIDDEVMVDRDAELTEAELLAQIAARTSEAPSRLDRVLLSCCNEGDDHVYIKKIADLASAHNTPILFIHMPHFHGAASTSERGFLEPRGFIVDGGVIAELTNEPQYYENWRHLNNKGAIKLTDYLAATLLKRQLATK